MSQQTLGNLWGCKSHRYIRPDADEGPAACAEAPEHGGSYTRGRVPLPNQATASETTDVAHAKSQINRAYKTRAMWRGGDQKDTKSIETRCRCDVTDKSGIRTHAPFETTMFREIES